MSTVNFDSLAPEITADSFVDSLKFQLEAFRDSVHSRNKTGTLSYNDWLQQLSEFLEDED